jgi:hypothetical protein
MTAMQSLRQPMTLGEIVGNGWALYRLHFHDFVALGTIGALPSFVNSLVAGPAVAKLSQRQPLTDREWLAVIGVGLPMTVLSYYTLLAVQRAALSAAAGDGIAIGKAYGATFRRFPALAVVGLLSILVPVLLVATLIGAPLGIYLLVAWLLSPIVVLAEGAGPVRSLGRSRFLVRGNWWRSLAVMLALAGLVFVLPAVLVFGIFGFLFATALSQALIGIVVDALTLPLLATGETALYFDLRARKGEFLGPAQYGAA